jgi:hypothetical protein
MLSDRESSQPSIQPIPQKGGGRFFHRRAGQLGFLQMNSRQSRRNHLQLETLERRQLLAADSALPVLAAVHTPQLDAVIANFAPPASGQTRGSISVSSLLTDGTGIAVTGTNLGFGQLFYSTDNGANWDDVGQVSPIKALLLAANTTTRLFFLPGRETPLSLSDAITFKAWSGSDGFTNGQRNVDTLLKPAQTIALASTPDAAVATAVAPNGAFAVTAERGGGITIVDLANPTDEPLARLTIPGAAVGVAISADSTTAYIAGDYGGLQIVDLTTPSQPQLTSSVETTGYALGVATAGSRYLFVANAVTAKGLDIIDLQAVGGPARVSHVALSNDAFGIAASATGRYAYVACGTGGLMVIDAGNPSAPTVVRSLAISGTAEAVALTPSGGHAFVASGAAGINVVSVANPATASVIRTLPISGYTWSVALSADGSRAYAATGRDTPVAVLSAGNPTAASVIGGIHATGYTQGVSVSPDGQFVLVGDGSIGTRVVDTAIPTRTQLVDTAGAASGIAITPDGKHAFVADDTLGLAVLALDEIGQVTNVGSVATGRFAVDAAVSPSGRYAYVADTTTGIVVVDAGNRTAPSKLRTLSIPSTVVAVAHATIGKKLIAADRFGGVVVYDTTNEALPVKQGQTGGNWPVTGLAISADGALAAATVDYRGLQLFDTSTAASPRSIATIGLGGTANAVALTPNGQQAFVAANNGLHLINLGTPTTPTRIATLDLGGPVVGISLSANGEMAYASVEGHGICMVYRAADGSLSIVGTLDTPGQPGASLADPAGNLLVATGGAGVFLQDVTTPEGFSLASEAVVANNYGTVENRGSIHLSRDATGRWLANTFPITPPAGNDGLLQLWRPAEAETIAETNFVFARHPSGTMHRLIADNDWQLIGFNGIGNVDNYRLSSEARAGQQPPAPATGTLPIEVAGTVMLRRTVGGELLADETPLTRDTIAVSLGNLDGLRPLAAESLPEGNRLLLRAENGSLIIWRFNASWQFTEAEPAVAADSLAASLLSRMFGLETD